MTRVNCTQIHFSEELKEKKMKSHLSWKEAVELGIETRLKQIKEGKVKIDFTE